MEKFKPLKRFGQNYLTDQNILNKIVDEINPAEDDFIIEIGPGQGALTKKILGKAKKLTAVEIDKRVVDNFSNIEGLNFISDDFLSLDLKYFYRQSGNKLRIVGNIPYNLTSAIIFKLIENSNVVNDSVLMVQYEVAKRMTAEKGTKDYGILSVLLKYFSDVKFCFKISPGVFYPKPKVYSAVVHIYFKDILLSDSEKHLFIDIVKAAFGNRRKTLKNSLSNSKFRELDFSDSGINLSLRAEQLYPEDFILLANFARKFIFAS
jgi:16S rRNA (adenine1518-N6/adenine1519-N6)-dimethyltransferase